MAPGTFGLHSSCDEMALLERLLSCVSNFPRRIVIARRLLRHGGAASFFKWSDIVPGRFLHAPKAQFHSVLEGLVDSRGARLIGALVIFAGFLNVLSAQEKLPYR